MANERVYISTQLLAVLPPVALKMANYLCNWQNSPKGILLYEKRFAKTLKLTEEEVRLSIQTLINLKLIELTNIDGKWRVDFNCQEWQKYYKIPMERVIEHEGYQLATKVEYDQEKASESVLEGLSDDALEKLIMELQKRKEKKKGCEVIYANANNEIDQLPF